MYANDGQRIFDAITFAPLVITGPFVLVGGIVYLVHLIGPWSLLGLLVYFIFDCFQVLSLTFLSRIVHLQIVLGVTMVRYRKKAIALTEERVGIVSEILRCIRLIKMNALEDRFMDRVQGEFAMKPCQSAVFSPPSS